MPFTIKKLKMWKDPGYTEECVEVPPVGSWKLPAADWENVHTVEGVTQSYDLRPRKYATLTSIELPIAFSETWDMSYLYMEAEDTAGQIKVFGWIRTVERTATSEEAVRISWVPDYWRTFSGELTFGRGTVTKGYHPGDQDLLAQEIRPIPYKPKYWITDTVTPLYDSSIPGNLGKCILFTYLKDGQIRYCATSTHIIKSDNTSLRGISVNQAENLAYLLGIPSASILGCWMCVMAPFTHMNMRYGDLAIDSASYDNNIKSFTTVDNYTTYWYELTEPTGLRLYWNQLSDTFTSDDTHVYKICDNYGVSYLTMPWGLEFSTYCISLEVGATEAYYSVFLSDHAVGGGSDYIDEKNNAIQEGRFVSIPMTALPVSSAVRSDYYITGQRDYEIESRRIEQEKQMAQGISGAVTSTIGGALTGAMLGSGPGAIIGAAIGLGTSVAGTYIGADINAKANDKLQAATDLLYSKQADQLITMGATSGYTDRSNGYLKLILVVPEDEDAAIMAKYPSVSGYDICITTDDVTDFVTTDGIVQVVNMQLKGPVPPAAKTAIKTKLESGVHIIENNPTGVLP